MIIDCGQRPTRLLWCGRETSKETGEPRNSHRFHRPTHTGRKNVIADARTITATPSLRLFAGIGRPLFTAASAILAVILCPVSVSAPEYNSATSETWSKRDSPFKFGKGSTAAKKMNTATKEQPAGIWGFRKATASAGPVRHHRLAQEVGMASAAPLSDRLYGLQRLVGDRS